jgi:hypothetical protein
MPMRSIGISRPPKKIVSTSEQSLSLFEHSYQVVQNMAEYRKEGNRDILEKAQNHWSTLNFFVLDVDHGEYRGCGRRPPWQKK